jgi:hypothetical protein
MKKTLFIILTATFATTLVAQPRTSYFMDKYANRHQLNPAMSPSMGYINLPGAGNIFVGLETNMKLSNYLYPVGAKDGQLGTFMHNEVGTTEFLRKIGQRGEAANIDVGVQILGFGFYTKHNRFWSADLNVKVHAGLNIPKDVFAFFKEMELGHGNTYNWKNLNGSGRAYVELAIGHARDIEIAGHQFRMGVKLKPLVGLGDVRFKVDNFSMHTTKELYTFKTDAQIAVLGGLIRFEDSAGIVKGFEIAEDIEVADFLNFGGALDLGVSYNMDDLFGALLPDLPLKGFTASFSITDLGFIRYKKSEQARFEHNAWFDGVRVTYDDSIQYNIDYFTDQFKDFLENARIDGDGGSVSRGLRTKTNFGLEYSFLNNKMSAGMLYSTHWGLPRRFSELTFSYNLRPVRWYSLSLSASVWNGFFRTAGWAMNFTPRYGFNFFFGMDYVPFAWTPKIQTENLSFIETKENISLFGLPIHNLNFNFNFGMSIPLGGNRSAQYGGTKRERRAIRREAHMQDGLQQDVRTIYQSVELE